MAKARRFGSGGRRSGGTTVTVFAGGRPRASSGTRRRRAASRPAVRTSTTRTRTLSQVSQGSSRSDNTGLIIGGLAVAAGVAFLLLSGGTAQAATPPIVVPGTPGTPGTPGQPGQPGGTTVVVQTVPMNPSFPQVAGASRGFAGPGNYRVSAPSGLHIRAGTTSAATSAGVFPSGTPVEVVADAGNGWFQVSSPAAGYMCASCPQAPGGPWLVRQS